MPTPASTIAAADIPRVAQPRELRRSTRQIEAQDAQQQTDDVAAVVPTQTRVSIAWAMRGQSRSGVTEQSLPSA